MPLTIPAYPPGLPPAPVVNGTQETLAETQENVAKRSAPIPLAYGPFQSAWLPCVADYDNGTSTWTVLGIVAAGELEAIDAVWFNGAAAVSGVNVNTYTGTLTQGVDSLMSTAKAGWDQTLVYQDQDGNQVGIAYVVAQWTNTHYSGFPEVIVEGRGRKVYDPRTASTAYSDTAALCMADMIRDPLFGLGDLVDDDSLDRLADSNEDGQGVSIFLPEAVRRIGLVLRERRSSYDWLETMRLYAGCWANKRGDTWHFEADRYGYSLTENYGVVTATEQYGVPDVARADPSQVPTQVSIVYTDDTPVIWTTRTYTWPETLDSGEERRLSEINMAGIRGYENAVRNALDRKNRSFVRSNLLTYYGSDQEIEREAGDVVLYSHPLGFTDVLLRVVDTPRQVEPGMWQVKCAKYGPAPPTGDQVTIPGLTEEKYYGV